VDDAGGPVARGARGPGVGPPRAVVPADAWQAAEPLGDYAWVGATVGPGFDFTDFDFGRDDAALCAALDRLAPALRRLL
jgi:predicted cupin superfamily sugar epimerase